MPRVRFTVRRMMLAVAILAVVLALEVWTFKQATIVVRHGDAWKRRNVIGAWAFVNAVIYLPVGTFAYLAISYLWRRDAIQPKRTKPD